MKQIRRIDWVVVVTALFFAVGCSGSCGGCDGMEPIPGGFPAAKRTANAAQIRVTPTAIAKITADPAGLIGPLVGSAMNGKIDFNVPASCGADPKICCVNGTPSATCGPLEIDLNAQAGDLPRMQLQPQQGASNAHLTLRARIKTLADIPVHYTVDCTFGLDSTKGSVKDFTIGVDLAFTQDATTGTTRITAQNADIQGIEDDDLTLGGVCILASGFKGTIIDLLKGQLTGVIESTVNDQVCKTCTAVADCGSSFAMACEDGVCKKTAGGECLQETGLAGRLKAAGVFGGFSPGTTGALDLYEVLGGYAATDNNGISLGMLGGMQPGGTARDRCGPVGLEPAPVTVTRNAQFDANARTDVAGNPTFDVAIGLSKNQLDQFAYAGYDGGFLCLTVGHQTVAQLTTDTLSLLSRSLGNLTGGTNAPMAVGLRPQSQPIITLGKNVFTDDGSGGMTLTEPLLDIKFNAMEIDFFASVDEQWIRVFTVVSDVHLPIGLQTSGTGQLVPVIGNTDQAFTNLSVKNSDAVTETPAELANLFPTILSLVLPQLSSGLGGFDLPTLGNLAIQPTAITSIDNNNFLAIFANLTTVMARTAPVETHATISDINEAAPETIRNPAAWTKPGTPAVTLDMGNESGLEYSVRIDGGTWSAWSTNAKPRLSPRVFWLPAHHVIEVRARKINEPETMDATPERLEITLGESLLTPPKSIEFHGQGSAGGCDCNSSGSGTGAGLFALLMLGLILPIRRTTRRAIKKLGPVVWATVLACLPGCSCGSDKPCGDTECMDGELPNGGVGRFTSIAGDDKRVLVATYDTGLGDLVVADATNPDKIELTAVDGIPDGTPVYDPKTYRGGITDAGPDVGLWTSIALADHKAHVAYYDVDNKSLRYAREDDKGKWRSMEVDATAGADVGLYTSITVDGAGNPTIAYLATGIDDGAGHFTSELRIARAGSPTPGQPTDFVVHTVVTGIGTCAGMCDAGTACIPATATDPETCKPTGTCTAACGDGQACVDSACVDTVAAPTATDIASGTGLYSSIALMGDGRLAVTYYDRAHHSLAVSVEGTAGNGDFTETVLDAAGDRGMWSSAASDGTTLHIAYQDALGDQLMYTTFNGTAGTPEVVDDGQRTGDRTHPVGASASIFLVNGSPTIAYQDGLASDVYVAQKGGSWTTNDVASGALIDGISVAGAVGPSGTQFLAWDSMDPATTPIHHLVVKKN